MLSALVVVALAGSPLVTASVQTPTLTSCSSSTKVSVSDVTITNAKIGQTMVVDFTLKVSEALGSNPTLKITLRKQGGSEIPCINNVGSCTYKLCGGTSSVEQGLAEQWNNQCPVPAMTAKESLSAKLDPIIQIFTGAAPTTIAIELKVSNGGTVVGCQSFQAMIAAA
ncbi:uncharacterized protein LOC144105535 [Amblyomma americanum]